MKLKDLEKIKLMETALMLGIPLGLILFGGNNGNISETAAWRETLINSWPDNLPLYTTLATIPRLTDSLITARIEPKAEDYKKIKELYNNIVANLANFLKAQNITDPVEIFAIYQFMYRNGYLSFNHNFNYDIDMKDLSALNGADVVRGTGVCRSISSFLTDLYKEMGYDACNLLVSANRKVVNNIDRQGNYPKWKISKKTNRFVKTISKISNIFPMTNHLITLVEKDGKTYIFDPTNDGFLVKGKYNNLVLPNQKEGRMKISYFVNSIHRILGTTGNLKSNKQIQNHLKQPTIDNAQYKTLYINSLTFIKNNLLLFEKFYEENEHLYVELFQEINDKANLILRLYPELNYEALERFCNSISKKNSNQK